MIFTGAMKETRSSIQAVNILEWAMPPVMMMASTLPLATVARPPMNLEMLWAMAS